MLFLLRNDKFEKYYSRLKTNKKSKVDEFLMIIAIFSHFIKFV